MTECLDAIANQTFKPHTVFIIDNASTDGTQQSVEDSGYCNTTVSGIHFKYIRLKTNQGGAGGFYAGMKKAYESEEEFEAIWVMDDDGLPDKHCLENLVAYLGQFDYICPLVLSSENNQELAFSYKDSFLKEAMLQDGDTLIHGFGCPMNGILFSRKLVKTIGYPIPELFIWGDEINYTLRAHKAGFTDITVVNAVHFHPKNRMSSEKTLFNQTVITVKDYWRGYCFFRNQVYNDRQFGGKNKYLRMAGRYLKYMYYFICVKRSFKWVSCFNDAFFSGFKQHPDRGYLKYMA